jgi:hypothetical protein
MRIVGSLASYPSGRYRPHLGRMGYGRGRICQTPCNPDPFRLGSGAPLVKSNVKFGPGLSAVTA